MKQQEKKGKDNEGVRIYSEKLQQHPNESVLGAGEKSPNCAKDSQMNISALQKYENYLKFFKDIRSYS